MAKKNFSKGIDNVFSSTLKIERFKRISELEPTTTGTTNIKTAEQSNAYANYNVRYPKDLQKKIKRFCLENDGIDMKDVFIQGAIMYMNSFNDL